MENDIRKNISENWIEAIEYLIRIGKLKSYRDLEEKTGIANQRIALIKSFVKDPDKNRNSYAHTDYLYELVVKFNVSLDFLFFKKYPIIKDSEEDFSLEEARAEGYSRIDVIEKEMEKIKKMLSEINQKQ